MDTMLAAVYHSPHDIRLEEVERPQPGPGEAVMRVRAASICATDLRIFNHGHFKIPEGTARILGHELAGEIVAVGEGATGRAPGARLAPGARVAVAPNVGCGSCWECVQGYNNLCPDYDAFGITLDGGFAQYMRTSWSLSDLPSCRNRRWRWPPGAAGFAFSPGLPPGAALPTSATVPVSIPTGFITGR